MEQYAPDYDYYYSHKGSRYHGWCPTCKHEAWRTTLYGIQRAMEEHHMQTHTGRQRTELAVKPVPAEPDF